MWRQAGMSLASRAASVLDHDPAMTRVSSPALSTHARADLPFVRAGNVYLGCIRQRVLRGPWGTKVSRSPARAVCKNFHRCREHNRSSRCGTLLRSQGCVEHHAACTKLVGTPILKVCGNRAMFWGYKLIPSAGYLNNYYMTDRTFIASWL